MERENGKAGKEEKRGKGKGMGRETRPSN